ncbi:MAG: phosphatase PAP2 family protein [Bacteroidia bacterium]
MLEFLYSLDLKVLYFINHILSNPVFDVVMPIFRGKLTWIPVYIIIVYFIIIKYGLKSIWVIGFALLTVLITDQISAGIIKPYFERLRPCNNPDLVSWLYLPNGKGSGWSFVSSHATNHFAVAVYFIMSFINYRNQYKIIVPFLGWALLIGFAQIYIGFHYPSDIIVGGILGSIIGFGMGKFNCLVLCFRSGKKL